MLAPLDLQPTEPPERVYSGFKWWHALLVEPNREQKAAEWLAKLRVFVYLPTFTKRVFISRMSRLRRCKLYPALPGMLFVPQEMMDIPRRDEVFKFAHVRGYIRSSSGYPTMIAKSDIELIRLMEAKLNLPPEAKGVLFKMGQRVTFTNTLFGYSWGNGVIIEIASESRIGVEVDCLFGRKTKVYVPASEIEAL